MVAHFDQLRQSLKQDSEEDIEDFLCAVMHTFTNVVEVCSVYLFVLQHRCCHPFQASFFSRRCCCY